MKEYEKLAKNYVSAPDHYQSSDRYAYGYFIEAYIQGFLKARAMCVETCDNYTHEAWGESEVTKALQVIGEKELEV